MLLSRYGEGLERAIKSLLKEDNLPKSKLTRDRLELKRSRFNPSRPYFSGAAYHDIEGSRKRQGAKGKERKRSHPTSVKGRRGQVRILRPGGHSRIRRDPNLLGRSHLFSVPVSQSLDPAAAHSALLLHHLSLPPLRKPPLHPVYPGDPLQL